MIKIKIIIINVHKTLRTIILQKTQIIPKIIKKHIKLIKTTQIKIIITKLTH